MIKLIQRENETRKDFLLRLAIEYIDTHTGFFGGDDELLYDGTVCDGYCLAEDIKEEFNIDTDS